MIQERGGKETKRHTEQKVFSYFTYLEKFGVFCFLNHLLPLFHLKQVRCV